MKKTLQFIGIIIFFAAGTATAQTNNSPIFLGYEPEGEKSAYSRFFEEHKIETIQKEYVPPPERPYDVVEYDLYMDWFDMLNADYGMWDTAKYSGVNRITLVSDVAELSFIDLDAENLIIDSVFVDGEKITPVPPVNSGVLAIEFEAPYSEGDTIEAEVYYRFESEKYGGLYLFKKGHFVEIGPPPDEDSVFTAQRIAYTMSEPQDARRWMPCSDLPNDKAIASISVRVPKGFTAAANGTLQSVDSSDVSKTFHWSHESPVATYLLHVAASKFAYYYDWYKRVSNPDDSIKVEYYVWLQDYEDTSSDGMSYNATHAFRNTVDMMEYFSGLFGEYPFERYGMVAVQDFWAGGMEHQTLTTLNRSVLRVINRWGYNNDYGNQMVIAHELAHQWIGDLVTCASWKDIWLNEGGATWSEALWALKDGKDSYYNRMIGKKIGYLYYNNRDFQPAIYAPPIRNIFNVATTYYKAGWFYHMVSEIIGRDKFLEILREVFNEFGDKAWDTEDFKRILLENIEDFPVDFEEYFDQWIYHPGHPVYNIETESRNAGENNYNVKVTLEQTQIIADVPRVYKLPVWIRFFGPEGVIRTDSVVNDERVQEYNFNLSFAPDSVDLEPTKTIFEIGSNLVSVKESKENIVEGKLKVFPNPLSKGENGRILVNMNGEKEIDINLYDAFGRKVKSVYSGINPKGTYEFEFTTFGLSTGTYIARCVIGGSVITNKLIINE